MRPFPLLLFIFVCLVKIHESEILVLFIAIIKQILYKVYGQIVSATIYFWQYLVQVTSRIRL